MARPKSLKVKERLSLSVSAETKEMAEFIRQNSAISISELVEKCIEKEYKKLKRNNDEMRDARS